MNSTNIYGSETEALAASVADYLSAAIQLEGTTTLATIEAPGLPPIYVLMSGTATPSASSATDTGQGVQWTIESGSLPELAQRLFIRLSPTNPPSTTPSKT